jgi:hypothetical protein
MTTDLNWYGDPEFDDGEKGSGERGRISATVSSALWALSNGFCYFPDCGSPVVREVRLGVYRKNVQVAHIFGVRKNSARFRSNLPDGRRDSFANLMLMCLPHHAEVDDTKTAEELYGPDVLFDWKRRHEGSDGSVLDDIRVVEGMENDFVEFLTRVFEPPLERLENIAAQLERTGTLNAQSLAELRRVVAVLSSREHRTDDSAARMLAYAAETLGTPEFIGAANTLAASTEDLAMSSGILANLNLDALNSIVSRLEDSVRRLQGGM